MVSLILIIRSIFGPMEGFRTRDIDVGLIDGNLFHQGRYRIEDLHHLTGDFLITLPPHGQEDPVRAESSGFEDRHGGTHSEPASLIGGSCCDSTLGTADDHRLPGQLGMIHLFNRGI